MLPIVQDWKDFYKNEESIRWKFQEEILLEIEKYQAHFGGENKRSALVKLPTGTGKTAIMAIYSNYIVPKENILIVVPSEALKKQIKNVLNYQHWEKIGGRPSQIKGSDYFEPNKLSDYLNDEEFDTISEMPNNYICTHQTLTLLKQEHDLIEFKRRSDHATDENRRLTTLEKLRKIISILFIDEGHREPAKTWSRIVRGFEKPTILFTATPYRNDLRLFNIDSTHIHEVDFQTAVDKYKVIRGVQIKNAQIDYSLKFGQLERKVELFVKQFVAFFVNIAKESYIEFPKAIIRCDNEDEIKAVKNEIVRILSDKEYRKEHHLDDYVKFNEPYVCSVHDQHTNSNNEFSSYDKALANVENSIFWVHQYKLMEGIDNDEFIAIGFFSEFQNARSLIQQIGRIIRKPHIEYSHQIEKKTELQFAYVFTDRNFKTSDFWQGYLNFEKIEKGKKIYGTEQIVKRIQESFPEYFYFDKQFSRVVSSEFTDQEFEELIAKELQVPKITNVYKLKSEISIESILTQFSENIEDNDIIEVKRGTTKQFENVLIGLLLGWRIKPTEQLSESIFFDISFEAYSIFLSKGYLFFRGSLNLSDYINDEVLESVEPELFSTLLLSDDGKILLKQLSVLNSDPSLGAVRRKIEGGNNLTNIAPSINDHLHVLTTAMGVVNHIPRYVGITRGRITDNRGSFVSTEEYIRWIGQIINSFEQNRQLSVPFLNRYASYVKAPEESTPRHILFDLTTFSQYYKNAENGELINEDFYESSTEIIWDNIDKIGKFNLFIENNVFELTIKYSRNKFKITLAKEENKKIKECYKPMDGASQSPVSFLKNSGIFRILTDEGLYYAEDHFFNPSIKLWGNGRFENIGLFYGLDALSKVKQEKEIESDFDYRNEFQERTIFHLIDKLKDIDTAKELHRLSEGFESFFPEYLICDDQSNELGDFIAFSEKENKVVVIHAKVATKKSTSTNSAVSFENVGDQVIKNLRSFDPYNFTTKDFHNNWDDFWTSNEQPKIKRTRRNKDNLSGQEIQNRLIALLKKDVKKEVWVMYGKGFRKKILLEELRKEDPQFNIKHLAYSIANYNEAVTRHGARLKIFIQP